MERALLLDLEAEVLEEQVRLLEAELRTTSQRVNLFEKVKIPETEENIKKISNGLTKAMNKIHNKVQRIYEGKV